jgi:hypothetical protein
MPQHTASRWQQAGWATYAAIMLFGGGIVGIVNGVWAFRYDDREADLVFAERNLAFWGWAGLLVGGVMLAAGIGVFYGQRWARWTGITVALIAIVGSVAWAEIQPTQSLIGAVINVSVVYALASHPVTIEVGE